MKTVNCQIQSKDAIREGRPEYVLLSWRTRMVMTAANWLPLEWKVALQKTLKRLTLRPAPGRAGRLAESRSPAVSAAGLFTAGTAVRVRPVEEIRATLNSKDRLRGCKFMPEMEPYCGTIQHVFKPVERFVNERDYTVRTSSGLVLLQNLYCQGFAGVGRCDRSCFYFWRVEWLEVLENNRAV